MFCQKCGAQNAENTFKCVACGNVLQQVPASAPPPVIPPFQGQSEVPNYLVQSILVTACCCVPFGIPAIVYSAQVNNLLQAGNYQGAVQASNNAKMWAWIGFGCGLAGGLLYGVLVLIGAASGH